MNGPVAAYVIHLARAVQRRPQVDRLIASCPVPTSILDAVDGGSMEEGDVARVYSPGDLLTPAYPFDISRGEIGCFLSHRKAWMAIIESGHPAGLVIEDDVEIDPALFAPSLEAARAELDRAGIIQFQVRPIREPGPIVARHGDIVFRRPVIVPLRASCTLYSADAARRLVSLTERFDRPVDGLLQLHWVTGLRPWLVEPSGVTDRGAAIGGTTIQARGVPFLRRLRRELLRPFYRLRIRSLSRRSDRAASGKPT